MTLLPNYLGIWLLQIIGILFPMLLFQSYFRKKYGQTIVHKRILLLCCSISILICMAFPVSIKQGYVLDFRFIPLLIGYIYGSIGTGIILSILLLVNRWFIGGVGFYLGGLLMTGLYFLIFLLSLKEKKNWKFRNNRLFSYGLLTLSFIVFAFGTQFLDDYQFNSDKIVLWLWFCILNYFTFWMIRYFQLTLSDMEHLLEKTVEFEKRHALNQLFFYLLQQNNEPIKKLKQITEHESLSQIQIQHMKDEIRSLERNQEYYWNFFKESNDNRQIIDLHDELIEVVKIIKPYADYYRVNLEFIMTMENNVKIEGSSSLMRMALLNIIKNAIEASSPNGRVNIALHELIDRAYIVVEDTGKGISESILSQIGVPLKSEKSNGTGLGLAAAYKITESLGGKIEIDSHSESGTIFNLYFQKFV